MESASLLTKLMDELGGRMLKALVFSLALHLALIMLIQPARQEGATEVVLQARIAAVPPQPARPPAVATRVEDDLPAPPAAEAAIPSETVSAPAPTPAPTPAQAPQPQTEATSGGAEQGDQAAAAGSGVQAATSSGPSSGLPEIPVMLDTQWYTAREVDVHPRPVQPIQPQYPEDARVQGEQGSVVLQLRIDQFGVVQDIEVVESSPPRMFDQSSLEAFRTARFHPAQRDGRAVRALVKIRVTYELY